MFVNKIPFLVTLGHQVKFTTIENLPNRWTTTLLKEIRLVIILYNTQKYSISTMFMVNEFEVLESDLNKVQVTLNTPASSEHIPEIKQQICVIKESVWAIRNTLPYTCLPSCMISQMVSYAVLCLDGLPIGRNFYSALSPWKNITGTTFYFNKNCKIEFNTYAKTHESPTPNNSIQSRT